MRLCPLTGAHGVIWVNPDRVAYVWEGLAGHPAKRVTFIQFSAREGDRVYVEDTLGDVTTALKYQDE